MLVATDFTRASDLALRRAAALAQACDGELELIHVVPRRNAPVYRVSGWQAARRDMEAEAMRKLKTLASRAKAKFRIPVRPRIAFGTPHAEIATHAMAIGARLVIVGAHDDHPLRDMLVGSTAQRLQRALRIPLLIARNRSTRAYRRVLVAIDFSPASAYAAQAAADLFPGAEMHFVHVCGAKFEPRVSTAGSEKGELTASRKQVLLQVENELEEFIRSNGLQGRRTSALLKQGDPAAGIEQAATEVRASIVAFGAKGKSRIEAGILGSVSGEFMHRANHDVLLVKQWRARRNARLGLE